MYGPTGNRNAEETVMTTTIWCPPDIHLATLDGDLIVLDVGNDRYDCLTDVGTLVSPDLNGEVALEDGAIADALRQAGVGLDAQPRPLRPTSTPPRREATPSRATTSDILGALLSLAAATAAYRGRSLSELVRFRFPKGLKRPFLSLDEDALNTLLAAERKARPWVPFEGECLQRAFQLRYYLAGRGVATDWVFGVRTWPFAAHCWLQIDDLVVGDRLERVLRFTPIMTA